MDFGTMTIGTVVVAGLIFGIVEAAKEFGLGGKWPRLLALLLGFGFFGLAYANTEGMLSEDVLRWVNLFTFALAGALSAMGYYDFQKKVRNGDPK